MKQRTCMVDGCDNPHVARGWCNSHYKRLRRSIGPTPSADRRFMDRTTLAGDCWLWSGSWTFWDSAEAKPHRWAYQRFVGPVTPGDNLIQSCDDDRCVNPGHLMLVMELTHDEVIASVEAYGATITGPPKFSDWLEATDRASWRTVERLFGSWISVLESAGYGTHKRGARPSSSRDEAIKAISHWSQTHGGATPTQREWDADAEQPSVAVIRRIFGNWSDAVIAAGLDVNRPHARQASASSTRNNKRNRKNREMVMCGDMGAKRHGPNGGYA